MVYRILKTYTLATPVQSYVCSSRVKMRLIHYHVPQTTEGIRTVLAQISNQTSFIGLRDSNDHYKRLYGVGVQGKVLWEGWFIYVFLGTGTTSRHPQVSRRISLSMN